MTPLLQAKNLKKTFTQPEPLEILKDISLDVFAGESVAILGKSGSGKSSLLHILGALDLPTSGTLSFPGFSSLSLEHIRLFKIGFVFQSFHLLEDYTLLENICMPAKIAGKKPLCSPEELLDEVGLLPKKNMPLKLLSGGEKQRASIARAFCNNPDLLLVDEPTGSLDQTNAKVVQDLLLSCTKKRNKALILVTHDEDFASLCDRVYTLKEGCLL